MFVYIHIKKYVDIMYYCIYCNGSLCQNEVYTKQGTQTNANHVNVTLKDSLPLKSLIINWPLPATLSMSILFIMIVKFTLF